MEYTSTFANMLLNPNHSNYSMVWYNSDNLTYILKDNTIYQYTSVWCGVFRKWLSDNSIDVPESRYMYTPVAKLEDGEMIGYNTQYANVANQFLQEKDSIRETRYPNLYFVEVGNHPYPKVSRYHHTWLATNFHKECHRILNPPSDPKEFFINPSVFRKHLQP